MAAARISFLNCEMKIEQTKKSKRKKKKRKIENEQKIMEQFYLYTRTRPTLFDTSYQFSASCKFLSFNFIKWMNRKCVSHSVIYRNIMDRITWSIRMIDTEKKKKRDFINSDLTRKNNLLIINVDNFSAFHNDFSETCLCMNVDGKYEIVKTRYKKQKLCERENKLFFFFQVHTFGWIIKNVVHKNVYTFLSPRRRVA